MKQAITPFLRAARTVAAKPRWAPTCSSSRSRHTSKFFGFPPPRPTHCAPLRRSSTEGDLAAAWLIRAAIRGRKPALTGFTPASSHQGQVAPMQVPDRMEQVWFKP